MQVVNEFTLELEEVEDKQTPEEVKELCKQALSDALSCKPEELYKAYRAYKQAETEFEKLYEPFKEKLLALHVAMQDVPNTVIVGGLKLTYVSPSIRSTIDSKKLKEEEPELAKKYTKISNVKASIRLDEAPFDGAFNL